MLDMEEVSLALRKEIWVNEIRVFWVIDDGDWMLGVKTGPGFPVGRVSRPSG